MSKLFTFECYQPLRLLVCKTIVLLVYTYPSLAQNRIDLVTQDLSSSEDWDSSESRAKNLLVFLVNILNLVGMGLLVVYTAYGMSGLVTINSFSSNFSTTDRLLGE